MGALPALASLATVDGNNLDDSKAGDSKTGEKNHGRKALMVAKHKGGKHQ